MSLHSLRRVLVAVAVAGLGGCIAYNPVPLRDGGFPRGAVQVGDTVRAETRVGESLSFEVTAVDGSTLTDEAGRQIAAGDLQSLRVERVDKRRTFITLGVVGGIVGTALLIDVFEDIEDCLEFEHLDCAD